MKPVACSTCLWDHMPKVLQQKSLKTLIGNYLFLGKELRKSLKKHDKYDADHIKSIIFCFDLEINQRFHKFYQQELLKFSKKDSKLHAALSEFFGE
jgi:hypothetical protein